MDNEKQVIKQSFDSFLNWLDNNGWDGFDPYDLQDAFIQLEKNGNHISKLDKQKIEMLYELNPDQVRKELNIKEKRNSKGLGLLLSSRVNLYKLTEDKKQLDEAIKIADWLIENPVQGYENLCYGYPFDWQSIIFIPKDTPSVVVSTVVGDGFWELYSLTRDKKYLTACESVCNFIVNDLKIDKMSDDTICFSYTPIDNYHVHNANLMAAEFLARIGKETENYLFNRLSEKAANYALSEQNADGSINYWGKFHNENDPIINSNQITRRDAYHSGFEIRALLNLFKHTGNVKYQIAYNKYLVFFLQSYILEDGSIKAFYNKQFPINIHGIAETVLLFSMLAPEQKELYNLAKKSLVWAMNNMQSNDGSFGHLWSLDKKVNIPYLRWGEAWMFRAFTEFYKAGKILDGEWGHRGTDSSIPSKKASDLNIKDNDLNQLRKLAITYYQMDKNSIPEHLLNSILLKCNISLNEISKIDLVKNIVDEELWNKFLLEKKSNITKKKSVNNFQVMMPKTSKHKYGSKEWTDNLFKSSENDPWGHDWRASQQIRYIKAMELLNKNVSNANRLNIIDIGCCLGDFTKLIKEYYEKSDVLGVDISPEAVRKCKLKYNNIAFKVSKLPDMPGLLEEKYDLISAMEVLCYVDKTELNLALENLYKKLNKDGYLLISIYMNKPPFHTPNNFKNYISQYFTIIDEDVRNHLSYYDFEIPIRQIMDKFQDLNSIEKFKENDKIKNYLKASFEMLEDLDILEDFDSHAKQTNNAKTISHSIILAQKK